MHLTLTSASTWILTAGLVAALGVGILVASDAFTQTPTPPRQQALVEPPPVPVPVPVANEQDNTEKALEQQLQQPLTFDFQDVAIQDVAQYLQATTRIPIVVHPVANFNNPVAFKAKDMSLRATLNNIAKLARVQYRLVDQAIVIYPANMGQSQIHHTEKALANAIGVDGETPWGKKILKALDMEVTCDFKDADLREVLNFLQTLSNINLLHDPVITAVGDYSVTLQVNSMKLRLVLNHIMRMNSLTYRLQDEAIFITHFPGPFSPDENDENSNPPKTP